MMSRQHEKMAARQGAAGSADRWERGGRILLRSDPKAFSFRGSANQDEGCILPVLSLSQRRRLRGGSVAFGGREGFVHGAAPRQACRSGPPNGHMEGRSCSDREAVAKCGCARRV